METSPPPHPTTDLPTNLYYQLVHTLTNLLPPPLDHSPEALLARNHAAIAKVAALLPVDANEADLAAQCIAARAQAEDILRLLRQNTDDIALVIRLNAQYGSMVRTSLSVHGRLMRVQAVRRKREATEAAATEDAWAQHVAERSMLQVVDPQPGQPDAPQPETAPSASPDASVPQTTNNEVSENETNSHDMAFETWLSQQIWTNRAEASAETDEPWVLPDAIAQSLLAQSPQAGRLLPANGPQNP